MAKQKTKITGKGKFLHESFLVTLALKGVDSVLQILGGVLILLVSPATVGHLVSMITQHELSEDPHDILFSHLVLWAQHFSISSQRFVALYLLSHGIVKIVIVVLLWRREPRAYPASIAFFLIFIAYQIYRYQHTHSLWLIALTVFDIVLIYLIWVEYRRVKIEAGFH